MPGVRRIRQSYRWRRRFAWLGVFVVLLGGVALAVALLPGSPRNQEAEPTGPAPPPQTTAIEKPTHVTAAEREAVDRTLSAFVKTALTRDDPAAAWDLVTADFKGGVTRKEWNAGTLPVIPFPAQVPKHLSWHVDSSYAGDLTLDLLLQPRRGTHTGAIAFTVELQREKRTGRWLIASMTPQHIFSPAPTKPVPASPKSKAAPNVEISHGSSLWWLTVPAAVLALVVLIPLAVLLNTWRRNRAIERRYRAERGL